MKSNPRALTHICDPYKKQALMTTIKELRDAVLVFDSSNETRIVKLCLKELQVRIMSGSKSKSSYKLKTNVRDLVDQCYPATFVDVFKKALTLFTYKRNGMLAGLAHHNFSKDTFVVKLDEVLSRCIRTQSEGSLRSIHSDFRSIIYEILATHSNTQDIHGEYHPSVCDLPYCTVYLDLETYRRINAMAVVYGFRSNALFAAFIIADSYDELLTNFS